MIMNPYSEKPYTPPAPPKKSLLSQFYDAVSVFVGIAVASIVVVWFSIILAASLALLRYLVGLAAS